MKDNELSGPNMSHHDSASGLTSANDMSESLPDKGWGGVEEVPGVDPGMMPPIMTSANQGFSPNGDMVGGPPPNMSMDGDDVDVPMQMLTDVGEQPDSTTGAGIRSAVGTSFNG